MTAPTSSPHSSPSSDTGGTSPQESLGSWLRSLRHRPVLVAALIVVLVLLVVFWPARFGGRFSAVVVASQGMEPDLTSGDLALVWRSEPSVGDVVAYEVPTSDRLQILVMHKVVSTSDGGLATVPIHSAAETPPQPGSDNVVGVVHKVIPEMGFLVLFLAHDLFLAAVVGVLVAMWFWPTPDEDESDTSSRPRQEPPSSGGPTPSPA